MKIVSWNVNGIRAIMKKDFLKSVKKLKPDVLCLQETKAQDDQVAEAIKGLKGYHAYYNSAEKKGYSGVTILSKKEPISVTLDMGVKKHDTEGRILCAEYEDFQLVTVYQPNSGSELKRLDYRATWDVAFLKYLKKLNKHKPVIVCGDLNVAHRAIDLKNDKSNYNKTSGYTQIEIDGLDRMVKAGFLDTYRMFYPEEVAYSYWSYRFQARARNTGWRIDYFMAHKALKEAVKSAAIHPEFMGSDHCPVSIEIDCK